MIANFILLPYFKSLQRLSVLLRIKTTFLHINLVGKICLLPKLCCTCSFLVFVLWLCHVPLPPIPALSHILQILTQVLKPFRFTFSCTPLWVRALLISEPLLGSTHDSCSFMCVSLCLMPASPFICVLQEGQQQCLSWFGFSFIFPVCNLTDTRCSAIFY